MVKTKVRGASEVIFEPREELDAWSTYDIGAASCLLCKGYALLSLDKEDPKKALFVFKKAPELEETVARYFDGTLRLPVRAFHDTLRALKNRLYSR